MHIKQVEYKNAFYNIYTLGTNTMLKMDSFQFVETSQRNFRPEQTFKKIWTRFRTCLDIRLISMYLGISLYVILPDLYMLSSLLEMKINWNKTNSKKKSNLYNLTNLKKTELESEHVRVRPITIYVCKYVVVLVSSICRYVYNIESGAESPLHSRQKKKK